LLTPGFSETTALLAVLEQKSFTKAANQLGLSPARVSELVRNLEGRLGVRLVERTTRSVAATPAGERLLERLRPLLDDYQAALESLNEFRSKPTGTLRLTVAPPVADFVLAPLVAPFVAQYPEITLDVSADRAFVDIVEGRFDAGIRNGRRLARDMIAVRVSDDISFTVVASPAYIERRGTPSTPHDLINHPCFRLRHGDGIAPWLFAKDGRTFEVQVDGPLTANASSVVVRAAVDGAGILQVPHVYVASELAAGRLMPLLTDWARPPDDGFYLYYSSRRQVRPALKVFVDFLRNSYQNGKPAWKATRSAHAKAASSAKTN
jgi:DNA-binding transcriptional LysR family regulator